MFSDYDSHDEEKSMRIARWTSDDINKTFEFDGEIGEDFHPDPTVGFAEGQFYLIVQRTDVDFVSPGPWIGNVAARVGADENGDGNIDQWTDWQTVSETYDHKPGFARIVDVAPAAIDLSSLPAAKGFKFEFKVEDTNTGDQSKPVVDQVTLSFE
jgi:hypothetical protein